MTRLEEGGNEKADHTQDDNDGDSCPEVFNKAMVHPHRFTF